jgi:hypothetical protein
MIREELSSIRNGQKPLGLFFVDLNKDWSAQDWREFTGIFKMFGHEDSEYVLKKSHVYE